MQATHLCFFPAERLPCVLHVGNSMEGKQRPGGQSYRHGQEQLHVQPFNVTDVLFLDVMS